MRALPAVQSASTAAYFERYENSRSHRVNAHPATRHGHYRIALGFTYTFPESRHKRRQRLISPLPASGAERGKTCSPLGIIVKWQRGGEGSVVKLAAQFRGVWSENPVDCEPAEVMQGATAGVTQRRLFLGG
jgi:hypothetical protein